MKPSEISAILSAFPIPPGIMADLNSVLADHEIYAEVRERLANLIAKREQAEGIGFRNGWVSFPSLRKTATNFGIDCSDNELSRHLAALGYVKHPGLHDGRTNNAVRPDNVKARLYIRPDHYSAAFGRAALVEAAYCRDQGFPKSATRSA